MHGLISISHIDDLPGEMGERVRTVTSASVSKGRYLLYCTCGQRGDLILLIVLDKYSMVPLPRGGGVNR